jgi:hypothetical protein
MDSPWLREACSARRSSGPRSASRSGGWPRTRRGRAERPCQLLAGQRPDLAPLQSSWRELPDPRERRHQRECLALLEAEVAVADRKDPIPIIAAARREIEEVHPSMRIERLLTRWALVGAVAIAGAALVSSTVS